jgi:hypothetical protein
VRAEDADTHHNANTPPAPASLAERWMHGALLLRVRGIVFDWRKEKKPIDDDGCEVLVTITIT